MNTDDKQTADNGGVCDCGHAAFMHGDVAGDTGCRDTRCPCQSRTMKRPKHRYPCPTSDCPGDARYMPPGKGHLNGCRGVFQPSDPPASTPEDAPTLRAEPYDPATDCSCPPPHRGDRAPSPECVEHGTPPGTEVS